MGNISKPVRARHSHGYQATFCAGELQAAIAKRIAACPAEKKSRRRGSGGEQRIRNAFAAIPAGDGPVPGGIVFFE